MVNLHEALLSQGGKSSYSACSNGALCLGLMGDLQQEGSNDSVTYMKTSLVQPLHYLVHLNFNLGSKLWLMEVSVRLAVAKFWQLWWLCGLYGLTQKTAARTNFSQNWIM